MEQNEQSPAAADQSVSETTDEVQQREVDPEVAQQETSEGEQQQEVDIVYATTNASTDGLVKGDSDASEDIVREGGISYFMVLLNLIKGLIGAGFLSLPHAFNEADPYCALVLLFSIALLSFYAMMRLVKCAKYHYTRLKVPFLSFGDVAKESFSESFQWAQGHGQLFKNIVNLCTVIHQFGTCSVYYLFISKNLDGILCGFEGPKLGYWWYLIIFLPLVILNTIMTMKILSVLCIIGNVLMISSLSIIITLLFMDEKIKNNITANNNTTAIAIVSNDFKFEIDGLFAACGNIIVSCLAQSLVLPLENKLKKPRQMLGPFGILSTGIFLSTVVYAFVGFFGYLVYGPSVKENIIDNFNNDKFKYPVLAIRGALCLSIFASFMLQMYVIVGVTWPLVEQIIQKLTPILKFVIKLVFRGLLVAVCLWLSWQVPNLSAIIRLIGVTTGTLLAFVFPSLFDLFTFVPLLLNQGLTRPAHTRLCITILVSCVGLTIMIGGLVVNIKNMTTAKNVTQTSGKCDAW